MYYDNLKSAKYCLALGLNFKYFKNEMKSHITLLHTNWTSMRNLVYETDFNLSLFCHDLLDWPTQWTTQIIAKKLTQGIQSAIRYDLILLKGSM